MHLRVLILEGDWAATRHGSLAQLAGRRLQVVYDTNQGNAFDPTNPKGSPSPSEVWSMVHREIQNSTFSAEVAADTTVGEFIGELARSRSPYRTPSSAKGIGLYASPTEQRLAEHLTLREAGLDDGDFVTLRIEHESMIDYLLLPGIDPEFIFKSLYSDNGTPPIAGPFIWGAILYTDEDGELAAYVRKYFLELNSLSGQVFRLFVLEKPTDWGEAKRYWRKYLEPELYDVFAQLRWLFYKPHGRHRVYEIAAGLGIRPDQLPCVVLVYGTGQQKDILVFPINLPPDPTYFRSLFAQLYKTLGDTPGPGLDFDRGRHYGFSRPSEEESLRRHASYAPVSAVPPEALWRNLRSRYDQIVASLVPTVAPSGEMKNFTFYGHTVFVNHPAEGVIIDTRPHEPGKG